MGSFDYKGFKFPLCLVLEEKSIRGRDDSGSVKKCSWTQPAVLSRFAKDLYKEVQIASKLVSFFSESLFVKTNYALILPNQTEESTSDLVSF